MFLLMFTYLFGGALAGSTGEYLQFLLPGILVQTVLFTTLYTGVALNTDIDQGRLRPLPLAADLAAGAARRRGARRRACATRSRRRSSWCSGSSLGFRRRAAGSAACSPRWLLVVVFAFGLSWVLTTLGLILRSPSAVMNAGFMALFPLIFLSNIFVDPSTLPGRWRRSSTSTRSPTS